MSVNEAIAMYSPSLSVKFAVGVSLFANAVLSLGTDRHQYIYTNVWNGKVSSDFLMVIVYTTIICTEKYILNLYIVCK